MLSHLGASSSLFVTFTRKKYFIEYQYNLNETILSRHSNVTDLGVVFDSRLTFVPHIDAKISEASRVYGFIVRNCRGFNNILALKTLYFSYVRSKLEYCSNIWNPQYNVYISRIERVQRKFLKYLLFKATGSYPVRGTDYKLLLDRFGFESLEHRRLLSSLTCLFKILHNSIDCPSLLSMINFNIPLFNSRQSLVFYNNRPRTNVLIRSPVFTMCANFNRISNTCDIFYDSINQVKRAARNL